MGWNPDHPTSVYSPSRGGYTVLINTWKRNSLLKRSVAHYASCRGTDAIHVVWSEANPPSYKLTNYLKKMVLKKKAAHKPNIRFDINTEDNLNNRFKPIEDLQADAIFSVDDDVIVPCGTLDFAFSVWKTVPRTMVGFVPRMHWLTEEKNGAVHYRYGGWWSVWWTGTYGMVLSKAAFFHKNYSELYTNRMPSSIQDYISRERADTRDWFIRDKQSQPAQQQKKQMPQQFHLFIWNHASGINQRESSGCTTCMVLVVPDRVYLCRFV